MKNRTTQKAPKEGYRTHTRIDGRAADVYDFGDTEIITGYLNFGIICPDYDVVKKYDIAARNYMDSKRAVDSGQSERSQSGISPCVQQIAQQMQGL